MTGPSAEGLWASGDGYEPFIGRWSRLVAKDFLAWLGVGTHARWLEKYGITPAQAHANRENIRLRGEQLGFTFNKADQPGGGPKTHA